MKASFLKLICKAIDGLHGPLSKSHDAMETPSLSFEKEVEQKIGMWRKRTHTEGGHTTYLFETHPDNAMNSPIFENHSMINGQWRSRRCYNEAHWNCLLDLVGDKFFGTSVHSYYPPMPTGNILGNHCFMHAVLQIVTHIRGFRASIKLFSDLIGEIASPRNENRKPLYKHPHYRKMKNKDSLTRKVHVVRLKYWWIIIHYHNRLENNS